MQRVLLSALLILVLGGLAGLVVTIPPEGPEETTLAEGTESGELPQAAVGSGEAGQAGESGANVASGATEGADPAPGGTTAGETAAAGGGTTVVPQGTEGGSSPSVAAIAGGSPADAAVSGTAPAPADPGAPTFDVVRVEPSGEALIAGVAEPNAEVEVLSNGEVVASVTADPSGAFIAMPASPLEPGEHLLTLRRAGDTSAEPEQEVAVVVPQDGGGVASVAPVAPSVPVAPAESQVAAAPDAPATPGAPGPVASLDAGAPTFGAVDVKPGGEAVIVGSAEPNARVEVLSNGEVVAEATADSVGAFTATPALPLGPGDHVLTLRRAGDASAEPAQEVAVVVPQDGGGVASVAPVVSVAPAEPQIAAAPDAPASPGVPGPIASLDAGAPGSGPTDGAGAAATDGSGAVASGPSTPETGIAATPAPATGDAATGDAASVQEPAIASAGQTAVPDSSAGGAAGGEPASGSATVDSAGSGGGAGAGEAGELIASAPPETPADGAAGTAADSAATAAPGQASPGQASPGQPAGDLAAAAPSDAAPPATPGETPLSVAAAEAEGSSVYVAGQAEPGSSVRVFANEDLLGEAQVNAAGNWMLEAQGTIPVGPVEIRADQTAGQTVVARTVAPFVRYPGYTPLIPNADTAAGLPASLDAATDIPIPANVIIRSGDNLWTISRRTYGHGIRYKSIYSANTDLIRNPNLIYPGQVFLLPTQRDGAAEPPLTQ